ncbi:MAG: 30S ribosomal protein S6e [Candidatus Woesearchaeota archaeon]
MVEFKIVIGDPKQGKSLQKVVKDDSAKPFIGLKIGDKVRGELIDLSGYEFEITGGSDNCGFPMRKDVQGSERKKIVAVKGVGFKKLGSGIRQRKTVCGNTIHAKTAQINLKVIKDGAVPLVFPEKEKKDGKKE